MTTNQTLSENDPLYDQAVLFVTQSRKGSISAVQREFKIGYNHARLMIEAMEATGIMSPLAKNCSRCVLTPTLIEE